VLLIVQRTTKRLRKTKKIKNVVNLKRRREIENKRKREKDGKCSERDAPVKEKAHLKLQAYEKAGNA
jgi:hypothetical protein